jgi:YaiO family outer membrane protein
MARILVVDDDDLLRDFLTIRLGVFGHIVDTAADGVAALDKIVSRDFDLILMDDVMPGLSGWEVLTKIREIFSESLNILMLSQSKIPSVTAKAQSLGAQGCLQKPFCPDELTIIVEQHCHPLKPAGRKGIGTKSAATVLALAAAGLSPDAIAQDLSPVPPVVVEAAASVDPGPSGDQKVAEQWTIAASQQWSWISNSAQPRWQDALVGLEHAPAKNALYTIEIGRSLRFSKTDHLISLRGDWRIARNASAYLGAATSPEANFRERWGVRAGGAIGLGSGVELSADGRIAHYATGTKFSLNPQVGMSFANERIALSAGWINLWESGGKHYQGWSARLRASPNDRMRLFAGLARYPEVETGSTIRVQSAFSGVSYRLSRKLEVSTSFARDKYEGAFKRQSVNFGLRWSWGRDP